MADETKSEISLIKLPEVPECLNTAVENITDAPTKAVGTTLADVWYLVFGGISHAAEKKRLRYSHQLDKYRKELDQAIDSIPEEKRIEPDIQVTAQALENSKYCIESDELRGMFVNLIAKSMNADYKTTVHPSFAEIIKQMSPDDARVLKTIAPHDAIALVDYIFEKSDESSYSAVLTNVYLSGLPDLDVHQNCAAISSLARLGLLQIHTDSHIVDKHAYSLFKETRFFKDLVSEACRFYPGKKASTNEYLGRLTALGENFVSICVQ